MRLTHLLIILGICISAIFVSFILRPDQPFEMTPEVAKALRYGRPVVALESTIITHGLPYPTNLEVALACEDAIRAAGAVPATIAIIDGIPRVGLSPEELKTVAETGHTFAKASRRDLGAIAGSRLSASTTVAATMIIAQMAGIEVFATGGIGGVHRGAETTFDESADLPEFARTGVLVVSAGAKSILDIPKTLERLETLGVPVWINSTTTTEVPAFYHPHSGQHLPSTAQMTSPAAAARAWVMHSLLLPDTGALLTNPIPEEAALDAQEVENLIMEALAEAAEKGIAGKDTTPFLLARLAETSAGATLKANTALVVNNARVAAEVAVEIAKMR